MIKELNTYNLCSTERRYREKTVISYYFQKNIKKEKQFMPIDIDGERMKLNKLTGEITNYKMKEVLESKNCSVRRTKILINMLLAMNDFDWFWTLTFDGSRIDRSNSEVVFDCYKKYINSLKHKYPNFKYVCFPERHDDGCFHFHLLTGGITAKEMGLVNSGKVCCSWASKKNGVASKEYFDKTKDTHTLKETDGETIYNVTNFIYGYTTVSRIVSRERCASYVKKYVEKDLGCTDYFKKRFYYSGNLNVPEIVKKVIGADFIIPKKINELDLINENAFVKNAISNPYLSDYNVLQIEIENQMKDLIENGYVPLDIEIEDLPFDKNIQLKIEDELF